MDEHINTKTARQLLGVTSDTLRSWASKDKIRSIRTPSNQRLYNRQDIMRIAGLYHSASEKSNIAYCRVSSLKQSDDLERQVSFLKHQFPGHEIITDIGSGINWKRKGLEAILERALQGNINEVVVAHRDRLCRFAFDLIKNIFQLCNVKLIVLNDGDNESGASELADDLLSIVTIYSCRQMGRRRYKSKKDSNVSIQGPSISLTSVDRND